MLIINADDLGSDRTCTNRILDCYRNHRITSTTAMVFMKDTVRAAEIATAHGVHVGLHLNFTQKFDDAAGGARLKYHQDKLMQFFKKSKYARIIYNPVIKDSVAYSTISQYDEFMRVFKRKPTHIDGHHHMHLCTNIIIGKIFPKNTKIRPTFAGRKEEPIIGKVYRVIVNYLIRRRYATVESSYKLMPTRGDYYFVEIVKKSLVNNVEVMTHPALSEEYEYLKSDRYARLLSRATLGSYASI